MEEKLVRLHQHPTELKGSAHSFTNTQEAGRYNVVCAGEINDISRCTQFSYNVRGQFRTSEKFWVPMIKVRFCICEAPVGIPT